MNPLGLVCDILARFSAAPVWAQLLTKVTLLLAVAWVVHFSLARANPRWRTLLWRGAAVGLLLMAVSFPRRPGLEIRIRSPEAVSATPASLPPLPVAEHDPAIPGVARVRTVRNPISAESVATDQPAIEVHPETVQPVAPLRPRISWPVVLLAIWGCGVALLSIRLAAALAKVARLPRASQAVAEEIAEEARRIAGAVRCLRKVEVRTSQIYAVPFQYGLLRPVVLLPERMCALGYRGQLPGIIAHELAHVMSWDFLWNLVMKVVSTMLWFHPLVWRIGSAHRAACDATCDAVSASYLGDVQAYCRTLAQVALEGAGLSPILAMPMARTCDVRRRIARLQERVFAMGLSRRAVVGVISVGLLSSALFAGVRFATAQPSSQTDKAETIAAVAVSPGSDLYGDSLPPGAIARLGTIRYRPEPVGAYVKRIAFASDDKSIIGITDFFYRNGSFCWWDATNGKLLRTIRPGESVDPYRCAITPDAKTAVTFVDSPSGRSSSSRYRLAWWDAATGKELAAVALADSESRHPLAMTPDGATVATCGNYDVSIWKKGSKEETVVCETPGSITDVALSPNGKMVAVVNQEEGVVLWDFVSEPEPHKALARSKGFLPWKAAFSADGKTLAVAGEKGNVDLMDTTTGRLLRTLDWPRPWPDMMAFSPNGSQLALASKGNHIAVWDLPSGNLRYTLPRSSEWSVNGMAFSHDSRQLAVGTIVLQVWDLTTGKCVSADFVGHEPYVGHVSFLGPSDTVATAGSEGAVRLWEARTGRQKVLMRHEGLVYGLAVSPSGNLLASSASTILRDDSIAHSVRIWDGSTGKLLHELAGRTKMGDVMRLGFSADGKRLAGAGDGKVRVWNVEDGSLLNENDLEGFSRANSKGYRMLLNSPLRDAVFSADIRFLVVDLGRRAFVFSTETGKELRKLESGGLQQPRQAISPDGNLLLSNKRADPDASKLGSINKSLEPKTHELRLWDLSDGKEIWHQDLPGADEGPACISADGRRFAVSVRGDLPEIRVCDLATRKVLLALKSDGHARCLSLSHDGRLLVAGMEDGTAITWDLTDLSARGQD